MIKCGLKVNKGPMSTDKNKKKYTSKRAYKNQRAGALARALTSKAMRQKGFMKTEIVTKWGSIVGEDFQYTVLPVSLNFPRGQKIGATLTVRTHSALAPLIQQSSQHIMDKINIYFGYGAVERLMIKQGPMPVRKTRPQRHTKALNDTEKQMINTITDEKAESELGKAVKSMLTTVLETTQ